jgi:hypothetical protein
VAQGGVDPLPLQPFYVDASMLGTAKVLAAARPAIYYPGQPGCPVTSAAMKDEEWLPIVGEHGWPVIMRDKRIRKRPGERAALIAAGVQVFVLTGAGQSTKWEQLLLVARNWETIERIVRDEPGPGWNTVTASGVRPQDLD